MLYKLLRTIFDGKVPLTLRFYLSLQDRTFAIVRSSHKVHSINKCLNILASVRLHVLPTLHNTEFHISVGNLD